MADPLSHIEALRRPRLLIRAARHGLASYSRERTLSRVLTAPPKTVNDVLTDLLRTEAEIEVTRTNGDVTYSVSRHLEVLIAMMAEARLMLQQSKSLTGA